ncbi:hypothetical protein FE782_17570 [Paenibacillus antri]|uniref:Uncharacterized protein n=1 Tax=Paenibacillus antri TaxID=2582848 RepID=A0A5R9G710_9BACL|nr:hypothetical protein [Paenibacillus antri]TLS50859.1 hypothetical protein FE782_17570 [Paenibacillus antri]
MNPMLRSLQMILFFIIFVFAPLSSVMLQEEHLQKSAELAHGHPMDAHVVDKQLPLRQKMLSAPLMYFLFIVLSFESLAVGCRMSLYRYPDIFLLRKIILLRPIKFTSTYVDVSFVK